MDEHEAGLGDEPAEQAIAQGVGRPHQVAVELAGAREPVQGLRDGIGARLGGREDPRRGGEARLVLDEPGAQGTKLAEGVGEIGGTAQGVLAGGALDPGDAYPAQCAELARAALEDLGGVLVAPRPHQDVEPLGRRRGPFVVWREGASPPFQEGTLAQLKPAGAGNTLLDHYPGVAPIDTAQGLVYQGVKPASYVWPSPAGGCRGRHAGPEKEAPQ